MEDEDFDLAVGPARFVAIAWAFTVYLIVAGVVIAGLWLVLGDISARAHEAPVSVSQPLGWVYDYSCCSTTDCRPVPDSAIEEGPEGYRIRATGELIPYTDTRVRDSKDEFFHWCSVAGADDSRTLCLYRAPRGY